MERYDLTGIRIKEISEGSSRKLHIGVSLTDSMRTIGSAKTKIFGSTMHIYLPLHLFRLSGKVAGQSDFYLVLPNGIDRVTLGKENSEIWPIDSGASVLSKEHAKAKEVAMNQFIIDVPGIDDFDTGVLIRNYQKTQTTIFRMEEPGYEAEVVYPLGRMIYQITEGDYRIVKSVKQLRGRDY